MSPLHHLASWFEFLSAGVAIGIGVAAWRRRDRIGARPLLLVAAGAAGWAACSGASSLLADPLLTRVTGYAVYPFVILATVGWVLLAAAYTGRNWEADPAVLGVLAGIVVLDVTVVATNGLHHRFATAATTLSPKAFLEPVPGPFYWAHTGVSLALFLVGLALLAAEFRTARGLHRAQTRALIGGGLLPVATTVAEVFDLVAVPGLGLGVVGLTVGCLVVLWALFYADFLEVTPVGRATLVAGMDEAVFAVDPADRLVDLNRAAAERFEVPDRAIGEPFAEALADYPALVETLEATEDGRTAVTVDHADRSRHYEVSVSSVEAGAGSSTLPRGTGRILARTVVVRDVTGRKERVRRLQQFRSVVETAGDPILVLGSDETVEIVNESMLEFLDLPRSAVVGKSASSVLPDPAARKTVDTLATMRDRTRSNAVFEFEHDQDGGRPRRYEAHMGLISENPEAERNEEPGAVCLLRDVTAHEERKAQLDLLSRILTRVLRHNIRNDLNVISGNAAVLEKRLDADDARMAAKIEEKARTVTDLADKANTAHQVTTGESGRTVLDLRRAVDIAVAAVTEQHRSGTVSVDLPNCEVVAAEEFEIAIEHLVENAIVHNDAERPTVDISASTGDGWVELTITDDGPGIETSEIAVLDRNEETELSHGSGLGLWIVNWIVEQSGGRLAFDTDPTGTTVSIRLARPEGRDQGDAAQPPTRSEERLVGFGHPTE